MLDSISEVMKFDKYRQEEALDSPLSPKKMCQNSEQRKITQKEIFGIFAILINLDKSYQYLNKLYFIMF